MQNTNALLSLGTPALVYLAAVLALASFARGYSGFGAAALVITGGSLVVAPQVLVPLIILIDTLVGTSQLRGAAGDIDWRRLGMLMLGSAAGTPLGVQALSLVAPDTARIFVALYVIAISLALLYGWRLARPIGDAGMLILGFLCGAITGLIGMGGLIVAAFLTADGTRPAVLRATLIAYFVPLGVLAIALMYWQGLYTEGSLTVTALALPIFASGVWLGGRHFLSATPEQFRRYTLGLLIVLGFAALVRALIGG